jgi:hypothetical protein
LRRNVCVSVLNGLVVPYQTIQSNVGPRLHFWSDELVCLRIILAQEFESPVGKDHAKSEGGVRRVLLENANFGAGLLALEQIGEIKACRAGTDDDDLQSCLQPALQSPNKKPLGEL